MFFDKTNTSVNMALCFQTGNFRTNIVYMPSSNLPDDVLVNVDNYYQI